MNSQSYSRFSEIKQLLFMLRLWNIYHYSLYSSHDLVYVSFSPITDTDITVSSMSIYSCPNHRMHNTNGGPSVNYEP